VARSKKNVKAIDLFMIIVPTKPERPPTTATEELALLFLTQPLDGQGRPTKPNT
jgi:hypothetical protein